MILFHPGPAMIDCRDCQQHVYDLKTGQRKTFRAGASREEKPCVRPKGTPPPCSECPKESPEKAKEHELSQRNLQTLRLYREARATVGACLTQRERGDLLLLRNLAVVDALHREYDRSELGREMSYSVARLFSKQ